MEWSTNWSENLLDGYRRSCSPSTGSALACGSALAEVFGAAAGLLAAQLAFTPVTYLVFRRVLDLHPGPLIRVIYRPLVAGAVMFCGVRALSAWFEIAGADAVHLITLLVICVGAGAVLYVSALWVHWRRASNPRGPERHALDLLESRIRPYLRRPV